MNPDLYTPTRFGWIAGAFGYALVAAAMVWIALASMTPQPMRGDFHAKLNRADRMPAYVIDRADGR